MPRISISSAQPGQRVAQAITNASGVTMVQAGAELTAGLIERLKSLGIATLVVAGAAGGSDRPLDVLLRELDARFAGHELDPWMMALKQIVKRQLEEAASPGPHA
jgi:hypothetical protein